MAKRNIEVVLTKNVFKLGLMGDLINVKPGYARNFLFPSGQAIPANMAAKRQIDILRGRAEAEQVELAELAGQLKKRLDSMTIEVAANVSHGRRLFGSVGNREIVAALGEKGLHLRADQVALHHNIREVGSYEISLQLHHEVESTITLKVKNANPNAELDEILSDKPAEEAAAEEASAE